VLAGWCAGVWAAEPQAAAVDMAARSAWQHGDAADRFALTHPHLPLRAANLIEWLARGGCG
jgi:NAD(P)H-hydrate repair Nnr-like enzyme with NAD(P)H-hydrate dehydratase domain